MKYSLRINDADTDGTEYLYEESPHPLPRFEVGDVIERLPMTPDWRDQVYCVTSVEYWIQAGSEGNELVSTVSVRLVSREAIPYPSLAEAGQVSVARDPSGSQA
jgi:hypothetical protein